MSVSREAPEEEIAARAAASIRAGGLVLYPSDTVYGICCSALDRAAVRRLAGLKGYTLPRPFVIVVFDTDAALELALPPETGVMDRLARWWPGPVSVVLPAGPACPSWVQAPDGTVALRVPADPLGRMLLRMAETPLVSSSANTASGAPALSVEDVECKVLAGVDLVIDGGRLPPSRPSEILRPVPGGVKRIR